MCTINLVPVDEKEVTAYKVLWKESLLSGVILSSPFRPLFRWFLNKEMVYSDLVPKLDAEKAMLHGEGFHCCANLEDAKQLAIALHRETYYHEFIVIRVVLSGMIYKGTMDMQRSCFFADLDGTPVYVGEKVKWDGNHWDGTRFVNTFKETSEIPQTKEGVPA